MDDFKGTEAYQTGQSWREIEDMEQMRSLWRHLPSTCYCGALDQWQATQGLGETLFAPLQNLSSITWWGAIPASCLNLYIGRIFPAQAPFVIPLFICPLFLHQMIVLGLMVCWFEAFIKKKKRMYDFGSYRKSLCCGLCSFFSFCFFTFELSPI